MAQKHELYTLICLLSTLQRTVAPSVPWAAPDEDDDKQKKKAPVSRFVQVFPLNAPPDAPVQGDVVGTAQLGKASKSLFQGRVLFLCSYLI